MLRLWTTVLILGWTIGVHAQCPNLKPLKIGKTLSDFIPPNWSIRDSVSGDFNQDGRTDYAIILVHDLELIPKTDTSDCNRPLLILHGTRDGFSLSDYCQEAVLCKQCGGAFGDPYASMTFEKNVLTINHYGGSAWKWTSTYRFRFQQQRWFLIGVTDDSFWSLGECENGIGDAGRNLNDANLITGKIHIIRTKDTNCKPYKDVWVKVKPKPLIPLASFNVDHNYFPLK